MGPEIQTGLGGSGGSGGAVVPWESDERDLGLDSNETSVREKINFGCLISESIPKYIKSKHEGLHILFRSIVRTQDMTGGKLQSEERGQEESHSLLDGGLSCACLVSLSLSTFQEEMGEHEARMLKSYRYRGFLPHFSGNRRHHTEPHIHLYIRCRAISRAWA